MRMLPDHLTCHAVVRWLERVDGRDLEPWRQDLRGAGIRADDKALCIYLSCARDAGYLGAVKALDTPALRAAAALRANFWKKGDVHVALCHGKAMTVMVGLPKSRRAAAAKSRKFGFRSRRYRRVQEAAE